MGANIYGHGLYTYRAQPTQIKVWGHVHPMPSLECQVGTWHLEHSWEGARGSQNQVCVVRGSHLCVGLISTIW